MQLPSYYLKILYANFFYPEAFLLIIPLVIILFFLIKKDFIKFKGDDLKPGAVKRRNFLKKLTFLSRIIIFFLIIIAIASPFNEQETILEGEPFLRILIDNSSSFSLFDTAAAEKIASELSRQIRVETVYVGSEDQSALGDALLSNLQQEGNVLFISDGYANHGLDLGDVALHAAKVNATIHTLALNPTQSDLRVSIEGPSKTIAEAENKFLVKVDGIGDIRDYKIKVIVDGQVVKDEESSAKEHTFTKQFDDGYHKIQAEIIVDDYFAGNNMFYKTVKVVPKPTIYYMTKEDSPMYTLLSQIYKVDKGPNLPNDLTEYQALIVNDFNAEQITDLMNEKIIEYLSEGNGMLVIGGKNSFEMGAYKESEFEELLPTYVSQPGKEEGDINIVIVVDISGSTGQSVKGTATVDIEKAQALAAIQNLRPENKVGIVAFNNEAYVIEPMSYIFEKVGLIESVSKLTHSGGTLMSSGILEALDMLKPTTGSKNIILISDGITQLFESAEKAAELADKLGVKIYSVGVGPRTNEFVMKSIAQKTNGIYFKVDQSSKLKILFGDFEEGEKTRFGLVKLNDNHFITENLEPPTAAISGYNKVVPKTTASLLVTTDTGDPILAVWRLGLGRVATLSTDDGKYYAGEMLNRDNSPLITRTANWVIGDPERNSEQFIDISDTRINAPTKITIKSPAVPKSPGITFFKTNKDMYMATIVPQEKGFNSLIDAEFAVNYPDEIADLGLSKELNDIVTATGGKTFTTEEAEKIAQDVRTKSKRSIVKKMPTRIPFVIAAMILLLLEIFIRRIIKNKG